MFCLVFTHNYSDMLKGMGRGGVCNLILMKLPITEIRSMLSAMASSEDPDPFSIV